MSYLLQIIWQITGSERVSRLIWQRECERRWNDRRAQHLADGGIVIVTTSTEVLM